MAKIDLISMERVKNTVIFNDRDIQSDYMQLYSLPLKDVIRWIKDEHYGADYIKVEIPRYNHTYKQRVKQIADQCGYTMEYKIEVGHYLNGNEWVKQWFDLHKIGGPTI